MRMGGAQVSEWMQNNVMLEDGAIKQYKEHIGLIDDPRIKRLLKRILSDEEAHRGSFAHFVEKAEREGSKDIRGDKQDKTASTLNWGIEHEYTVILQYLLHSYLSKSEEAQEQLADQAVNEMQHLGWLAEELASSGGNPKLEHIAVDKSTNPADMLKADIKIEKEVAGAYDKAGQETDDADLKKLLFRIRDNELYHIDVFNDLLEEAEGK